MEPTDRDGIDRPRGRRTCRTSLVDHGTQRWPLAVRTRPQRGLHQRVRPDDRRPRSSRGVINTWHARQGRCHRELRDIVVTIVNSTFRR